MSRLGPRRRATRVVLQFVFEGHDEVRGDEGPVSRERNLGSRVGGDQEHDAREDGGSCQWASHVPI